MDNYSSFSVTTIGYSHIVKETACEDSSLHFDGSGVHVAVVADGHGDRRCVRSAVGSAAAAELAKADLLAFADSVERTKDKPETAGWMERLFRADTAESVGRQLGTSILVKWSNRVLEHYEAHPLTEEELASSGLKPEQLNGPESIRHLYGTTLIAALLTEDYLAVVHQGDGRCVVVHGDGTIDQPVPWDDRCQGRETTSLCDDDAVPSCRFLFVDLKKDPVAACFVASDGVEDSYEDLADVNAFFGLLTAQFVEMGGRELTEYLEGFLPDFSRLGSRDDVSIAGIVDPVRAAPFRERFRLLHELRSHETEARRAGAKLRSMFRKTEYLTEEYEKARAGYEALIRMLDAPARGGAPLRERLKQLFGSSPELRRSCEAAEAEYREAKQALDEYMERRATFETQLEEANGQIEDVKDRLARLELAELTRQNPPQTAPLPRVDAAAALRPAAGFGGEAPAGITVEDFSEALAQVLAGLAEGEAPEAPGEAPEIPETPQAAEPPEGPETPQVTEPPEGPETPTAPGDGGGRADGGPTSF